MHRILMIALVPLSLLVLDGCKTVDCGEGTIEKDGKCVAGDSIGSAACGPFTELEAGQCVPTFPPTVCDDDSTDGEVDNSTGVTTCIGTGAGFACPPPETGKQTICGQLHDLETGAPFSDPGAQCVQCVAPTATGACSIGIRAVDAVKFAMNPMDPGAVLATGPIYLDDCGRYKVPDIDITVLPATSPFVGLGIDDANPAMQGPAGTTHAIGLSTPKVAGLALKDFEAFIAKSSTITAWTASGGPPISGGMFVGIFRAMSTGLTNQAGVTITRNGQPIAADDHYFVATQAMRTTVDPATSATGANGTVLVTNAMLGEGYTAAPGPLPAECKWSAHAGVSLPFILFVQVFRPVNATGMTCPL